jgi:8-oxo-dGTP pyrophosphatase MutT (NUDIX family)
MTDLENVKVSATIIVISSRDLKALIVQRKSDEKIFPDMWTVAGGKMQDIDGLPVTSDFLYYSAEGTAIRELKEETGIIVNIGDIKYLCSITAGKVKRLILSYYVVIDKYAMDIEVKLNECQDYKWIIESEIQNYKFIPDIGGEIHEVFGRLRQ